MLDFVGSFCIFGVDLMKFMIVGISRNVDFSMVYRSWCRGGFVIICGFLVIFVFLMIRRFDFNKESVCGIDMRFSKNNNHS